MTSKKSQNKNNENNENEEEPMLNDNNNESTNEDNSLSVDIPKMDPQELAVFKQNVKQWMRLDDSMRGFQKELKAVQVKVKQMKSERDSLDGSVMGFMKKYKLTDLSTSNGSIKYNVKQTKESLNVKKIKEKLDGYYVNNKKECENVINFLIDSQAKKEKVSLSRVVSKKTLNL
jgi:hypothetical protein